MKKSIKTILISLFLTLLISHAAYAGREFLSHYTQTAYNVDNGMEANEGSAVIQTEDGYIWIASYSGLIRYDGSNFVRFSGDEVSGFIGKSATALFEDSKGRFWVGTNESGLFRREGGKFIQVKSMATEAFNSIRSITEDSKGHIYVGSGSGVGILKNDVIEQIDIGYFNTSFILGLACDNDNRIWGVTRNGALFIIKDNKLLASYKEGELIGRNPISIIKRKDGTIFAGMADGGVVAFTMNSGVLDIKYSDTPGINSVNSMYEDREGRLWVCGDNGVGFFDKRQVFTKADGSLVDSSVEKMCQDYENGYWFASSRQGVLHVAQNKFMDINFAALLNHTVVNSTLMHKGKFYVAADDGLFIMDSSWNKEKTKLTDMLTGVRVRCLMADSRGNIWISTYKSYGVIKVGEDGSIKKYSDKEGLPDKKVRLTFECANGDIAVGTNAGVALIRNGKIAKTITASDGLKNTTVLSLCEDPEGALYIGTDGGGVYKYHNKKLSCYTNKDGLSSGIILRMLYDEANRGIWISTGNNLNFYDMKTFRNIKFDAPVNSGMFDLKKDKEGSLIVLSDTGVHIADPIKLLKGEDQEIKSYMKKEGLPSTITANSWSYFDNEGNLYLCCSNGTWHINLYKIFINKARPKIAINKAEIDGTVYLCPKDLKISKDAQRLTLELAVLSFTNPQFNKVEYLLEGFDKNRTSASAKNLGSISYTNIRGGSYTFRFTGINSDGVISPVPMTIEVEKENKIYEEPFFIFILLVLSSFSIFYATKLYYQKRNEKLLQRQRELRTITAQAMTAIANTIDAKDTYTKGHSSRVARYSVKIAEKLGMSKDKIDNLYYTALLHDIGKIGVPDEILNKPGPLTDEEYSVMKEHPAIGGRILKVVTVIDDIKDGAAYHHERYDGRGYNSGLEGNDIPLIARIIGVADAVDAMGSTRPYRAKRTVEYVISELENGIGKQFDPRIANIFISLLRSGEVRIDDTDESSDHISD